MKVMKDHLLKRSSQFIMHATLSVAETKLEKNSGVNRIQTHDHCDAGKWSATN